MTEKQLRPRKIGIRYRGNDIKDLVRQILNTAAQHRASNIHVIHRSDGPSELLFRIGGYLMGAIMEGPVAEFDSQTIEKIMNAILNSAGGDTHKKLYPQSGRFTHDLHDIRRGMDVRLDIRMSYAPMESGSSLVLRLLHPDIYKIPLDKLGFPLNGLEFLRDCFGSTKAGGLVLFVGPTNSGKSTVVSLALKQLLTPGLNAMTLETPVERMIPGARQFKVDPLRGMGLDELIEISLHQDPDVLMLGEITDPNSAQKAMRMAMTGRLVLSTMHANDSLSALTLLLEHGVTRAALADRLKGIFAQRLVSMYCQHCKVPMEPSAIHVRRLGAELLSGRKFFQGKGCPKCNFTGYSGSVLVVEFLRVTPNVKLLILEHAPQSEIMKIIREEGYITFIEDGLNKPTTLDEILHVSAV